MNRFLLILNVVAAGSIVATNSASVLTAISPYGGSGPAKAPAPAVETAVQSESQDIPADSATSAQARVRLASFEAAPRP